MKLNRTALKSTFQDVSRLPSSKFFNLIDSLWRAILRLFSEQLICDNDLSKIDESSVDYNTRYVYVKSTFTKTDGSIETSWSTAHGFGHVVYADFAQVHGFYNYATSMYETIMGTYGAIHGDQNADTWVSTDRLFTIANGEDEENRSDCFSILKNGFIWFSNQPKAGILTELPVGIYSIVFESEFVHEDSGSIDELNENTAQYVPRAFGKYGESKSDTAISCVPPFRRNGFDIYVPRTGLTIYWSAIILNNK